MITLTIIFSYKNHLIKIISSLIFQELLQVKFINCFLRENILCFTKNDIRDWDQVSTGLVALLNKVPEVFY